MIDGRILFDLGVTNLPSFVIKIRFAPPVSSIFVLYDTLTGIQMGRIEAPEGWIKVIK